MDDAAPVAALPSAGDASGSTAAGTSEYEADAPPAPTAPAHELLRITDAAGNAAADAAAALRTAGDAAGAMAGVRPGAGEGEAEVRAAALLYVRGFLPAGKDEGDASPVKARRSVLNGPAQVILELTATALKSKVANGALAGSEASDIMEA